MKSIIKCNNGLIPKFSKDFSTLTHQIERQNIHGNISYRKSLSTSFLFDHDDQKERYDRKFHIFRRFLVI